METNTENVLNMSDEEFMKLDPSNFEGASIATSDDDGSADTNNSDAEAGSGAEEASADDKHQETDEGVEKKATPAVTVDKETQVESKAADVAAEVSENAAAVGMTDEQYVNVGKQIMAEFKANGTTIKVKNVEDAIQLMQMGANYHKKMSGLKPSLKLLKLLENNGLSDPEKLNYLIDLSQKKPEAITQLLKDSKIDPMNIDLTGEKEYVPQNRSVSDTEILLDEVLDSISNSPSYNKTLTVLGDEWDSDSRSLLAQTPEVIRTINAHMENGIYDQVDQAVKYERSLGKLTGVNDYEAYQRIGTYMHENKLFKVANVPPVNTDASNTKPVDTKAQDAIAAAEAARVAAKKAASPSRSGKGVDDKNANYNPLTMSDEDFIKFNKLSI